MKLIPILLALMISSFSFSQDDTQARSILDKVANQYKSYNGAALLFTFDLDNQQEDIQESINGKAWTKENAYKVNLMGVETYFDGTTKWSYMVDAEEVNITTPEAGDKNEFNPSQLFTEYQEGYRLIFVKEIFEKNRALQVIDLLPIPSKVKESEFSRIKVKVDKDKQEIYQIIRYGKDGNNYTITILKMVKEDLKETTFKFDPAQYPDVEVIDLRD